MITATNIRKDARNCLTNKWGKGALIAFCYSLVEFAINLLSSATENYESLNLLVSIATLVISVPLSYGLLISFIKLKRDEEVHSFDFLTLGFSAFSRAWKISFSMLAKLVLPIILTVISVIVFYVGISMFIVSSANGLSDISSLAFILFIIGSIGLFVSGIYSYIKQLSLVLSYNIAYDEPNLTEKEVVEKSQSLMKGNRGNYFVLNLSFIGWAILAILTLGIGYFWLIPYIQVSCICFYDYLINKSTTTSIDE